MRVMDELLKALRHFIVRDAVLLVSGGSVVTSFLYLTHRMPRPDDSWLAVGLLLGISYFVGYAIQDGFSLTRLSTTASDPDPGAFVQWMYSRYTGAPWEPITMTRPELEQARERIQPDPAIRLERIVSLKQVCTAGGPCFIVCSVLLGVRWGQSADRFDGWLASCALGVGILLVALGRLKAAQQAKFIELHGSAKPAA